MCCKRKECPKLVDGQSAKQGYDACDQSIAHDLLILSCLFCRGSHSRCCRGRIKKVVLSAWVCVWEGGFLVRGRQSINVDCMMFIFFLFLFLKSLANLWSA